MSTQLIHVTQSGTFQAPPFPPQQTTFANAAVTSTAQILPAGGGSLVPKAPHSRSKKVALTPNQKQIKRNALLLKRQAAAVAKVQAAAAKKAQAVVAKTQAVVAKTQAAAAKKAQAAVAKAQAAVVTKAQVAALKKGSMQKVALKQTLASRRAKAQVVAANIQAHQTMKKAKKMFASLVPPPAGMSYVLQNSPTTDPKDLPDPVPTTPNPPTPPDWDKSLETAIQALTPFIKVPVPSDSVEYQVLSDLLTAAPGIKVTQMERVVNPGLWKKFKSTRRDLLSSKSNDFSLLSGLGMNDSELQLQTHVFLNFDPPKGIESYAENVALLFHGTRGNLDAVLSQGLDDRLGRDQGLLGRGIYFADDPLKSVNYDSHGVLILCAVLLGDAAVNQVQLVREPEKGSGQKRNHADLFFDSIVGRPAGVNEFVIYNRHQCVPLYLLHYTRGANASAVKVNVYADARAQFPPFAWSTPSYPTPLLRPAEANRWPFFAHTIFKRMCAQPDSPTPVLGLPVVDPDTEEKLRTLMELGFWDNNLNLQKLTEFGGNLERTIDALLEHRSSSAVTTPSIATVRPNAHINLNPLAPTSVSTLTFNSTFPTRKLQIKLAKFSHLTAATSSSAATAASASVATAASTSAYNSTVQARKLPRVNLATSTNGSGPAVTSAAGSKSEPHTVDNLMDIIDAVASGKIGGKPDKILPVPGSNPTTSLTLNPAATKTKTKATRSTRKTKLPDPVTVLNGTSTPTVITKTSSSATTISADEDEDCPICCVQSTQWLELICSHKLCAMCHVKIRTSGRTMSGAIHSFVKCPFCQGVSGIEIGTCPDGTMTVVNLDKHTLPGYEGYGTISVNYIVSSGKYQLNRTGYLPNTPEGVRLLGLLRIAWDRRHVFSVGTSLTTGQQDVLVWNIHHKTGLTGGVKDHAYPDPTYLKRLQDELQQYALV